MCQHCSFANIIIGITISKCHSCEVCIDTCREVAEKCKEIKVKHLAYTNKFLCFNRIFFKKSIYMLLLNPDLIAKIGFSHV